MISVIVWRTVCRYGNERNTFTYLEVPGISQLNFWCGESSPLHRAFIGILKARDTPHITFSMDCEDYHPTRSVRVGLWLKESWITRFLLESPISLDLGHLGVLPSYEPEECRPVTKI